MMNYKEINKIPMFFIVGRARSGTTLLQTMLDAHPSIIIPGESCILMHLKNKYFHCSHWSNATVDLFLNDILHEKKLKLFWNLDLQKIREQIFLIPEPSRNFMLLCKILYLNYPSIFKHDGVSLIGDKNPIYTLFIKDLLELFPTAKFIHLVRDYRANIVSNKEAFSLKDIATLAHAWKYHNKKVESARNTYSERFLLVRYEDLSMDPANEMKNICGFLGIAFNPVVFDFHKAINEHITGNDKERFGKHHANLLKPVNSENIESWKKKLNTADIALAEFITGDYALKYGYPHSVPKANSIPFRLKSLYGNARNRLIHAVIKSYYYSPFSFKVFLSATALKLNQWFKVKSYYNQTDSDK